jgi:ADP-ribosylglycohydrolase
MHLSQDRNTPGNPGANRFTHRHPRITVAGGVLSLAAIVLLAGAAEPGQQQQQQPSQNIDRPYLLPEANRLPDANAQMQMRNQEVKQQSFDAANAERKKQLSDDSAKLLTLAMALKAEVDKTNKDMLSLNVIRKADEIEKLAHNVKEKMKVTVGGS